MTVWVRDADGSLEIKAETWDTEVNPTTMKGNHGHEHEHGHRSLLRGAITETGRHPRCQP